MNKTMKKFQEAIKQTTSEASSTYKATVFDAVLEAFVVSLQKIPAVDAKIEYENIGSLCRRSLVTWPKYRRNEKSIMITFFPKDDIIRAISGNDIILKSKDELIDYLVDFLKNSAFPSTIQIYSSRISEDCDAILRAEGISIMSKGDTLITLSAMSQKKFAETKLGKTVTIDASLQPRIGSTSNYNSQAKYKILESAGYVMQVLEHRKTSEGELSIKGIVINQES